MKCFVLTNEADVNNNIRCAFYLLLKLNVDFFKSQEDFAAFHLPQQQEFGARNDVRQATQTHPVLSLALLAITTYTNAIRDTMRM